MHWTRNYNKVCADERIALEMWARERYGAFPTPCSNCAP